MACGWWSWLHSVTPRLFHKPLPRYLAFNKEQTSSAIVETLIYFLHAKTILLILDNCEHLLGACAQLADKLLKNCPNLKILATSREALGIIGEALYHVPSLTIPEIQKIESIEKLNDYKFDSTLRRTRPTCSNGFFTDEGERFFRRPNLPPSRWHSPGD